MKLTEEEIRKVNASLATLKEMTAAQLDLLSKDQKVEIDRKFMNELIEAYVTEDGFACLLLDTMISRLNCICGSSCSKPCNTYMKCRELNV